MSGGVMRFGRVEFDTGRGRLRVAGRRVALDRSSEAILAILLEEAGKRVDKDRLLAAGWPGRVVHENSLAKAIGRLRYALGEDGCALETVHGYGYRLAADVEAVTPPNRPPRRFFRPAAAVTALGVAAIATLGLDELSVILHGGASHLAKGEPADSIGRVLWVDDHPENNTAERRYLERRKIAVYQVRTSEDALALLSMYEYRAVISDMNRNDRPLAGIKLVREMRRRRDRTPFFLYTVVPSPAQRMLLAEAGGQGATVKPGELYAAILPLFGERDTRGRSGWTGSGVRPIAAP